MGSTPTSGGAQIRNPQGIPDNILREELQEHGFVKGLGSAYLRHKSDQKKSQASRTVQPAAPRMAGDAVSAVTEGREYRNLGKARFRRDP